MMTAAEDLHQRGLAAAAGERFEEAVALLEQAVAHRRTLRLASGGAALCG